MIAAYSTGQFLASPFYGLWAEYRGSKETLLISMTIYVTFNLLYAYSGAFNPGVSGWVMMVARLLTGIGGGTALYLLYLLYEFVFMWQFLIIVVLAVSNYCCCSFR